MGEGENVLRPIYDLSGTSLTNTSSFRVDCEKYLSEGACITAFSEYFFSLPPGLTFKNSTWCSPCVQCFVRISEQRAAIVLYIIS